MYASAFLSAASSTTTVPAAAFTAPASPAKGPAGGEAPPEPVALLTGA
jgi:hypothetical protein